MSEPAPELQPIADAFRAAGMVSPAEPRDREQLDRELLDVAERGLAEMEHVQDVASIKRGFRKGGLKGALSVGKALGWSKVEIEALFTDPASGPLPKRDEPSAGPRPSDGFDQERPGRDDDGRPRGRDPSKRPVKPLPDDCPVIPLGMLSLSCHYLDPLGQHVTLTKHSADDLKMLFGPRMDWPWIHFPKFKKSDDPDRPQLYAIETGYLAESLMEACGKRGIFDPAERLRGVGAWRGAGGELVLHCGDQVLFVPLEGEPEWREPGYHGDHVYPGADRLPKPADAPADTSAGLQILDLLSTWSYDQPDSDAPSSVAIGRNRYTAPPIILLGWTISAMIGGALEWRTHVALTGPEGAGKSTLQKLIGLLLGKALVQSTDATAAGVYQHVGYSSRAAAIDEAENDPNSTKMKNMVELVRNSSSGGTILRGSNDAKTKAFTARTSFLLSAIFLPPFSAQDLTRVARVELRPLDKGRTPPVLDQAKLAAVGRQLRRRLVDGWPRWEATLTMYRAALAEIGHDSRGCDKWGYLLACADLCLFDSVPDTDSARELADVVAGQQLRELTGDANTSQSMIDYLTTLPVEAFRGGNRVTIGTLVAAAAGRPGGEEISAETAAHALRAYGIFVKAEEPILRKDWRVTLPNSHAGLAGLLERTPYATRPGAASSGWSQAMRRLPGARAENSRAMGGRGWSVPVEIFLGEDRT